MFKESDNFKPQFREEDKEIIDKTITTEVNVSKDTENKPAIIGETPNGVALDAYLGKKEKDDLLRALGETEEQKVVKLIKTLGEVGTQMKGEPQRSIEQCAKALYEVELQVKLENITPKNKSIQEIFSSLSIEYSPTNSSNNIEKAINTIQERLVRSLPTPKTLTEDLSQRQLLSAQYVHDLKVLKEQNISFKKKVNIELGLSPTEKQIDTILQQLTGPKDEPDVAKPNQEHKQAEEN